MIEVGAHPCHSGQGIADCAGQRAFARYVRQLGIQPSLQTVEDWTGFGLPDLGALVGRQPPCHLLDGIKLGDPPDGRVGDGRALGLMHAGELAAHMGHAGNLADIP